MPMGDLADQIPGLREAMARERDLRELAFLGMPEPVAGLEMAPLTLERMNLLMVARNAYVCGGEPTAGQAAMLLWVCSPAYRHGDRAARDAFIRRVGRLSFLDVDRGIRDYLDAALFDFLAGSGSGAGNGAPPAVSWVAAIVDAVAHEYHWSRAEIMRAPLAELAQYLRRIEQRAGGRPRNPLSDAATAAWLAQVNKHAGGGN